MCNANKQVTVTHTTIRILRKLAEEAETLNNKVTNVRPIAYVTALSVCVFFLFFAIGLVGSVVILSLSYLFLLQTLAGDDNKEL
jgi:hypothetical protein